MTAKELIKYLRKNEDCKVYVATDMNYESYIGTMHENWCISPLTSAVRPSKKMKKLILLPEGLEEGI